MYNSYYPEMAYRFIYKSLTGVSLEGLVLHHLCQNKLCVNPTHLMVTTKSEHTSIHFSIPGMRGLGRPPQLSAEELRNKEEVVSESLPLSTIRQRVRLGELPASVLPEVKDTPKRKSSPSYISQPHKTNLSKINWKDIEEHMYDDESTPRLASRKVLSDITEAEWAQIERDSQNG